jgi:hypothetical protein
LRDTQRRSTGAEWIDAVLDRVRVQVVSIDDDWTAVALERR